MKFFLPLTCCLFFNIVLFDPVSAQILVGDSTLINNVQESDTFTIGSGTTGTRNGNSYSAGTYPLPASAAELESDNSKSWGTTGFSINNDATAYNGANAYPGGSGAGSATGITQTGFSSGEATFGVAYGESTNFFVQSDATHLANTSYMLYIGSTNAGGTSGAADGLTIYFNNAGSIDISNSGVGTTSTGFTSVLTNPWNNYAADFNLASNTVSIFTNQSHVGTLNLYTFDGGAYANVLDPQSNGFVGEGASTSTVSFKVFWTDNFQVGTYIVPEPSTWALMVGGLLLLLARIRKNARRD